MESNEIIFLELFIDLKLLKINDCFLLKFV